MTVTSRKAINLIVAAVAMLGGLLLDETAQSSVRSSPPPKHAWDAR